MEEEIVVDKNFKSAFFKIVFYSFCLNIRGNSIFFELVPKGREAAFEQIVQARIELSLNSSWFSSGSSLYLSVHCQ